MMKKILITSFFCCFLSLASGHVILPAIINHGMVLQQKANVLLWGWDSPGRRLAVTTSWNQRSYSLSVPVSGRWQLQVSTPAAGGPYQLIFDDGEPLTIKNILIGEVWLCSGQSNMEMPVKGYNKQPVLHSRELIQDADRHPDIRVFRVPKVISAVPREDCKGQWFLTDSETVKNFSAIAYQYALNLQARLHVPIGIISTYWGGTAIQSWMDKAALETIRGVVVPERLDTIADPEKKPEESPCILYNSMIHPIAGYTIRGFIWYQGESNRYNPPLYQKLMPVMVREWRELWRKKTLPFYYVQIAPYGYSGPNSYFSALVREAQLHVLDSLRHTGMVVALDAGQQRFIHPPDKTILSERLAVLALDQTYHLPGYKYTSPSLRSVKLGNSKVLLKFANTGQGLQWKGDPAGCFELAGPDHVFHPAQAAIIAPNRVAVSSPEVPQPVAVRYAFHNWTVGTLFSSGGVPVSSFRTDDWP